MSPKINPHAKSLATLVTLIRLLSLVNNADVLLEVPLAAQRFPTVGTRPGRGASSSSVHRPTEEEVCKIRRYVTKRFAIVVVLCLILSSFVKAHVTYFIACVIEFVGIEACC